jgi:hypothetical protein
VAQRSEAAHAPRPGRARKRIVVAAVALVVVAAVGGGGVALAGHAGKDKPAATEAKVKTTTVERTDLSDSQTLPGNLGFGGEESVKGTGTGLVTRLPKSGTTVTRGKPLYWVDDRPVPVFFGDTPFFRKLDKTGVQGRDVTVLADNLRALGYDIGPVPTGTPAAGAGGEPSDTFTPALSAALERWQRYIGMKPTGTLAVGQVTVVPGEVRVASVKAQLGDPVAGELLSVTSPAKVVTVPMDAGDVDSVGVGMAATVVLPGTKEIPAKVTSVSTSVKGGGPDDGGDDSPPQRDVTVTPLHSADVKGLDAAAVQVRFTTETRHDVLAVPVDALVALRGGGYALQRPGGTLVAVRTGMYAQGLVEVTGDGLTEGQRVVTAS